MKKLLFVWMATGTLISVIGCSDRSGDQASALREKAEQDTSALKESAEQRAASLENKAETLKKEAGERAGMIEKKAEEKAEKVEESAEKREDQMKHHGSEKKSASFSKADITQAQTQLKELGHYKGQIDGVVGKQTQDAVRSFQESEEITVTSQLDTDTINRLSNRAGKSGEEIED